MLRNRWSCRGGPASARAAALPKAAPRPKPAPKPAAKSVAVKPKPDRAAAAKTEPAKRLPSVQPRHDRAKPSHPGPEQPRYVGPWYRRPYYAGYRNPYGYYPYGSYNPYGYAYGYTSDPYGSGYPYGYSYGYTPYVPYTPYAWPYPPPVFMPAELLYGPQAMLRFMGVSHWGNPPARAAAAPRAHAAAADAPASRRINRDDDPQDDPSGRGTNERATTLGWKFVSFGDAHFGNQKYADALDRYKKASQSSPQLADAFFRQGFAQAALGRYDAASKAFKRGMELNADWPGSGFRLDEIYGVDDPAKKARLDAMTRAAEAEPNDGNLAFVLGIHLHFDGRPRAGGALPPAGRANRREPRDQGVSEGEGVRRVGAVRSSCLSIYRLVRESFVASRSSWLFRSVSRSCGLAPSARWA